MKSATKGLLAVGALLSFALAVQTARIIMLFRSPSAKKSAIVDTGASTSEGTTSSRLPLPDLITGLTRQQTWPPITSKNISGLFPLRERSIIPLEDSLALVEKEVSPEIEQKFEKELPARLMARLRTMPQAPEIPEVLPMSSPRPDLKTLSTTSRYWYLMSRWFFSKNQHETALAIAAANLLLAHEVETANIAGASMVAREVANAMRFTANTGILEMSGNLNIPAAKLKKWTAVLMRLHDAMPGLERVCMCAKKVIPSAFHPDNLPDRDRLSEIMSDPGRQKEQIDAYYDPIIEACKLPFSEAMEVALKKQKEAEELQTIMVPGLHYFHYFFNPEDFLMKYILSTALPKFSNLFEQDFMARQISRGTISSIALRAYQLEHKALPDSLDALEKWLGKSLPKDVYTDKPIIFNKEGNKILQSTGPDGLPNTTDDLVFMPITSEK